MCMGQLSTTCSNVLKQPNGKLLVAVNHNQLRTTASETVDPIDWSHSPPSWVVPPERLVHSINQYNLGVTRTCKGSRRGNHLAYAATQGTIIIIKKVVSARLRESDVHPISPKTPVPQYQTIDRKNRKGKRVEDYSRDRTAEDNKEALALLLKPASPTPSNTGLARSFQRDTEMGIKVLLYF